MFAPKILKYLGKIRINFLGHSENFYFWVIFYCTEKAENRQSMAFYFKLTNKNRKQKVGTEGSAH